MQVVDIFETKTVNQLRVLKCLYESNGIVNVDKISKMTSLDTKTVNNLLEDIFICFSDKKNLTKMDDYLKTQIKIYQASWVYELCVKLILGKEVSIISFTLEYFISESKLRRKIKNINELLCSLNLKIISRNGDLYISGKETQIRFLGYQFFWEIHKGVKWPFEEIEFTKIWSLFREIIFKNTNIQIKDITYVEWSYIFTINLIRFNQGNIVKEADLPAWTDSYFNSFSSLELEKINQILDLAYHLTTEEKNYFFLLLQTKPQFYLDEDLMVRSIQAHNQVKTDSFYVYQSYVKYLNERTVHYDQQKLAVAVILAANMSTIMTEELHGSMYDYGMEAFFEKSAPHLLPNIEKKILDIQKEYPNLLFLKKIRYLTLQYAESYSLVANMLDFEPKILVGVITELHSPLEEMLIRKLRSIFSLVNNIDFFRLGQDGLTHFDFVLKTSVTIKDLAKQDEVVLVIDPSMPKGDLTKISNTIKEIKKMKE